MAHLAKQSLPTPEVLGSKLLLKHYFLLTVEKTENKEKEAGKTHSFKKHCHIVYKEQQERDIKCLIIS